MDDAIIEKIVKEELSAVTAQILEKVKLLQTDADEYLDKFITQLCHKQMTPTLNHCNEKQEEKRSIDIKRGYNLQNPTRRRADEKAPE